MKHNKDIELDIKGIELDKDWFLKTSRAIDTLMHYNSVKGLKQSVNRFVDFIEERKNRTAK